MKSIQWIHSIAGLAAALLCSAGGAAAQQVRLEPGSTVRVEGSSALHRWSCTAGSFTARVLRDSTQSAAEGAATVLGELLLPIADLECGDDRMERQMRAALKNTDHPHIRYALREYQVQHGDTAFTIETTGTIAVAGVERPIDMLVHGAVNDSGVIRATGSAPFRMSDFGIKPPTAFFGLLKASDEVTVRFELRVRQEPKRLVAGS
jgi:polyisoprenoid-binding protein YceI